MREKLINRAAEITDYTGRREIKSEGEKNARISCERRHMPPSSKFYHASSKCVYIHIDRVRFPHQFDQLPSRVQACCPFVPSSIRENKRKRCIRGNLSFKVRWRYANSRGSCVDRRRVITTVHGVDVIARIRAQLGPRICLERERERERLGVCICMHEISAN